MISHVSNHGYDSVVLCVVLLTDGWVVRENQMYEGCVKTDHTSCDPSHITLG